MTQDVILGSETHNGDRARPKMHANELETDEPLVRRLLATQFPQWAELPIEALPLGGTDNAIYRLGDELSVRGRTACPPDTRRRSLRGDRATVSSTRFAKAGASTPRGSPVRC